MGEVYMFELLILVIIIGFVVFLFSNGKQRTIEQIDRISEEIFDGHLKQAINETDLFISSAITPSEYQKLATLHDFTERYVNYFCSSLFSWGFQVGQEKSEGKSLTPEQHELYDSNKRRMISELREAMGPITTDNHTIGLYINAMKQCYDKGVEAGTKQGKYIVVSR
jgi:hypothetical protein